MYPPNRIRSGNIDIPRSSNHQVRFYNEEDHQHSTDEIQETAKQVYESATRAQSKIKVIQGETSEDINNTQKHWSRDNQNHQYNLTPYNTLNIETKSDSSYLLNELEQNQLVFLSKFNHLLIRKCDNITIELMDCAISGIDILYSSNITITAPIHNYANVEYTYSTNLLGRIDTTTLIQASYVTELSINSRRLPVDMFSRQSFSVESNDKLVGSPIESTSIPNITTTSHSY